MREYEMPVFPRNVRECTSASWLLDRHAAVDSHTGLLLPSGEKQGKAPTALAVQLEIPLLCRAFPGQGEIREPWVHVSFDEALFSARFPPGAHEFHHRKGDAAPPTNRGSATFS